MTWNYRVVKRKHKIAKINSYCKKSCITYGIHEVYYNKNGKIRAMSTDPMRLNADNLEDLKQMHKWMKRAFEKRTLTLNEKRCRKKKNSRKKYNK